MKIRLAKELAEVCCDYCNTTWDKALTAARVPTNSALRLLGSVYYHPQIQAIPSTSSLSAPVSEHSGQPLVVPDAFPPKISMESTQVGDQSQGAEGEKRKDKGKKPSTMLQRRRKQRLEIKRFTSRPRMLPAFSQAKGKTLLPKHSH